MEQVSECLGGAKKQNFDHFLLLDFEATCEEGRKILPHQEIIEFPVIHLCGKSFEEVGRFHRYVRPTERPILTSFCTELTGIVQDVVAKQETLPEVLVAFHKWLVDSNLIDDDISMKSRFTFITCGDWDLGVILPEEARYRKLRLPEYFKSWINLKKAFCKARGYFAKSMTVMLHDLELKHLACFFLAMFCFYLRSFSDCMNWIGRLHSGIDDVRNMCQIARSLARSGYIFQETSVYVDGKQCFENISCV
ncbi:unnamed protein product [Gongylonema pulchrum]|uniref:Exonuclease domain-containing protein n=1 Tax=Gongylonema pulchrum TaxID=637853 RepID=A0A183E5W7_9BILA|nr:unnamed protein product [Gongylonema pulchrum]